MFYIIVCLKFSKKGLFIMKRIVFSLFLMFLFIGCGGSSSNSNEPSVVDTNSSVIVSSDTNDSERKLVIDDNSSVKEEPKVVVELTGFAKIQDLIKKSRSGELNDVTYICVGDSTRAKSKEDQAHLMFERVKATLDTYNVNSILKARGSQELLHFLELKLENGKVRTPTYKDVINATPGSGATTIVDFCLGINDLWDMYIKTKSDMADAVGIIKDRVLQSIELIKTAKPDINFVLTSPSPLLDWTEGSEVYAQVYKEVSAELDLPYINYVDDIMPPRVQDENSTSISFEEWYRLEPTTKEPDHRDQIHFSEYGLYKVADYILEHILPKD